VETYAELRNPIEIALFEPTPCNRLRPSSVSNPDPDGNQKIRTNGGHSNPTGGRFVSASHNPGCDTTCEQNQNQAD
jgi:hypothetical protein